MAAVVSSTIVVSTEGSTTSVVKIGSEIVEAAMVVVVRRDGREGRVGRRSGFLSSDEFDSFDSTESFDSLSLDCFLSFAERLTLTLSLL